MATPTHTDLKPEPYTDADAIETPAVVVDLDVMDRNLERFASFAEEHHVSLRSHVKTHKTPALAHRQHERTGGGIVCQTVSEAEVMAAGGIDDIYLSYMVVGDRKLDRLIRLSEGLDSFATTVDCPGNIHPLQAAAAARDATIDVILELDVGLNRVGVGLGDPAVELARLIADQPNLSLAGVMAYEGHIAYGEDAPQTESELEAACLSAMDDVEATVERIEEGGHPIDEVKVGSTPTSLFSGKHPIVTEINPGMYPFMDARLIGLPHIDKPECALTVRSTVISAPADDRVIVDAGSKSISLEVAPDPLYAGETDEAVHYANASEEHGWIDIDPATVEFDVGDTLDFIPPHVCPTINLHDTLVGVRDGQVETVWTVQGRGKVK